MRASVLILLPCLLAAEPAPWKNLLDKPADSFKAPMGNWFAASKVTLDRTGRRLVGAEGTGSFVNGKTGREPDLYTREAFGDVEIELEFLLSRGSNSGVKFHGLYEIQLCDSHDKKGTLTGDDCGGIYPRANLLPVYRHIDTGIAPKLNACKPHGEWQVLSAVFQSPHFADGKKVKNARLVRATLNGKLIHEDVELKTPTGHNWTKKEMEKGPLMLQGDHGPVAFRNVKIRAYSAPRD